MATRRAAQSSILQVSDGSLVPINVPNVVGLDRTTADANISAANLTVGTPLGVNDAAPINQVVSQTPGDCTGCAIIGSTVDYSYSIGLPVGNYVGLQQAVAEAAITGDGFAGSNVSFVASDQPTGEVVAQAPAAGGNAASSTVIDLQVSDGSLVPINVPNVVGLDRATADANISAANLTVGTPLGVNDAAPINQVVSQTPGDCTGCAIIGSTVDYSYSIGLPVGNYVGLQQAVAEAAITGDGFAGSNVSFVASDQPTGEVVAQAPAAGGNAASSTVIDLQVSDGSLVPINVPNVVGLDRATADANISAANLTVGTPLGVNDAAPINQVVSQTPGDCTGCAIIGSTVDYSYSIGLPVGNYVGLQQAVAEAAITGDGFAGSNVSFVASDQPTGEVVAQAPAAGGNAASSTVIDLQVSDGSLVPINVPNVVGLDRATADANISAANLTVGTPLGVNDAAPINQVVSQTPGDCTGCAIIGSTVDYSYSIGLPVGNYVGLQQAVAEAAITGDGFAGSNVSFVASDQPTGEVVAQAPAAGGNAAGSTVIDLQVSDGSLLRIDIPNVVGLDRATADATIIAANLTVGTASAVNAAVPINQVVSQTPGDCTGCAIIGSAIDYSYSIGLPVGNYVGLQQAAAESSRSPVTASPAATSASWPAINRPVQVLAQSPVAGLRQQRREQYGHQSAGVRRQPGADQRAEHCRPGSDHGRSQYYCRQPYRSAHRLALNDVAPINEVVSQTPTDCTACTLVGSALRWITVTRSGYRWATTSVCNRPRPKLAITTAGFAGGNISFVASDQPGR